MYGSKPNYRNLTYNNCTILTPIIEDQDSGKSKWNIKCHCGNIFISQPASIKSGNTTSCGCLSPSSKKNYRNATFHNCMVIDPVVKEKDKSKDKWNVKCHCGNIFVTTINNLKRNTQSCGCYRSKMIKERDRKCEYINFKNKFGVILIEPKDIVKDKAVDMWIAKCPSCDNLFEISPKEVMRGRTNNEGIQSCGCTNGIHHRIRGIKKFHYERRVKLDIKNPNHLITPIILALRNASVPILALILKMDNHKCRLCGSVHNLIVHHIIPIQDCIQNDDRTTWNFIYDNKNLITLCQACHIYQAHDGNGRFYLNENIKNRLLGIAKNRQISEILRKEYEMKVITIREWIKNV